MNEIEKTISLINGKFGEGAIFEIGKRRPADIDVIPTGIMSLDIALTCGGLPKGRITEIYGMEGSSKTTIVLHAISEAQKKGERVAFVDMEHALDINYAQNLGINTDELLLSQPSSAEEALEIMELLVRSDHVGMVVLDSVAALVPKAELDGDYGDSHMGLVARLMSQTMRKMTAMIAKKNVAVVYINQLRSKIGVVYGNPLVTTGGVALKFYSSVRIECSGFGKITAPGGSDIIGKNIRFKVVKNKLGSPFKQTEVPLIYGEGIDKIGDLLSVAVSKGIVKKGGSWYSFGDKKIGQGAVKASRYLKDNPDILELVKSALNG